MSARDQFSFVNVGSVTGVTEARRFMQQRLSQEDVDTQILTHRLYAVPFIVGENGITIARVGVNLASATQSVGLRIGFYTKTDSSNLWPGTFLLDAGSLSLNAAGAVTNSVSLVASANDLLWVAFVTSHASPGGSIPAVRGGRIIGPLFGVNSAFLDAASELYVSSGNITSPFPGTFPTSQGVLQAMAQALVQA